MTPPLPLRSSDFQEVHEPRAAAMSVLNRPPGGSRNRLLTDSHSPSSV